MQMSTGAAKMRFRCLRCPAEVESRPTSGRTVQEGIKHMRLRIDTTAAQFFCTREAEQRTVHETGAPRIDKETGLVLWQVQLMSLDQDGGEILAVTVADEPKVKVGEPVAVDGLVAIPWSQGDRSGVAFRATSIRPADAQSGVLGPRPIAAGGSSQSAPGAKQTGNNA